MYKIIRITTIPLSLEKLLEGQLTYMNKFYNMTAISSDAERLEQYGKDNQVRTFWIEMSRAITPFKDLRGVVKLYIFLRKEKPTIVHTHTPKAGIIGMLAAKIAGVPIRMHTVAGLPLLETKGIKRKVLNAVEKMTYSLATHVYPNSMGLKKIILSEGFTLEQKLKVLGKGSSNGIDTSYFNPDHYTEADSIGLKKELGIPPDDLVFIFIGRLVSEKGLNELVSAFNDLQKKFKNITLLLIGPFEEDLDPLTPNTQEIISKHLKIVTTGYQQDVRPFFLISDVLVFPSYREGFPNVVLQAGAMGIPCIVSNINGCNEIIKNNENGLIIPVKDKAALFQSMEVFVSNPQLREELASGARLEICKNYDRKEFWNILKKEYENLLIEAKISHED